MTDVTFVFYTPVKLMHTCITFTWVYRWCVVSWM